MTLTAGLVEFRNIKAGSTGRVDGRQSPLAKWGNSRLIRFRYNFDGRIGNGEENRLGNIQITSRIRSISQGFLRNYERAPNSRDNPWKPAFLSGTVPCNATYLPTYLAHCMVGHLWAHFGGKVRNDSVGRYITVSRERSCWGGESQRAMPE
jgi:hypothetical protein